MNRHPNRSALVPAFAGLALTGALLAGCTAQTTDTTGTDATGSNATGSASAGAAATAFTGNLSPDEVLAANADYTTVNDDEWSESDAVDVTLAGSTATSDASSISIDGSTVTVTQAGVYRFSGSLQGQLVVAAPDDAQVVLILDDARIENADGAAIEVQTADDVALFLAGGSENSVSDASFYAEDAEANAAIYSTADLTISGTGTLKVQANGNDGITSKDDLVILSGTISVTAADDALRGKDSLVVEDGTLILESVGGDGMKSDQDDDTTKGYILVTGGSIDITSGDDGVQAQTDTIITGGSITASVADDGIKAEQIVSIGGGTITVTKSTEAMEAINVGIFAGTIDLTASDDGINAAGLNTGGQDREMDTGERVEISGGTITIHAGTDGIDSNGTITITGGEIVITSADNGGDGPLDANGALSVADGTVTANGSAYDPATAQRGPGGMGGGPAGGMGGGPFGGPRR